MPFPAILSLVHRQRIHLSVEIAAYIMIEEKVVFYQLKACGRSI